MTSAVARARWLATALPSFRLTGSGPVAFGSFTFTKDPTNFNDPSTYPAPTRYTIPLGDTSYSIMNPTYGVFFQDNWTINAKLTLNVGVRYDLETGTSNTDVPSPIQPGTRPLDKNKEYAGNVSPLHVWEMAAKK